MELVPPSKNSPQSKADLLKKINDLATERLKELLETKHLYQRVSFDIQILDESRRLANGEFTVLDQSMVSDLKTQTYFLSSERQFLSHTTPRGGNEGEELPHIRVENLKLFCRRCGGAEVFSPVWYGDIKEIASRQPIRYQVLEVKPESRNDSTVQVFGLLFQCQRCKGEPEGFIVRREGWSLSLHGRSPMEQVQVPNYLPKKERQFFRDAVIAMQAGKSLAALFYLRTFIEQFARRQTGKLGERTTGEDVMSSYSLLLPKTLQDQAPSLKKWYSDISEALHYARADDQLFEEGLAEIDRHFDFRRIYKIPDVTAQS